MTKTIDGDITEEEEEEYRSSSVNTKQRRERDQQVDAPLLSPRNIIHEDAVFPVRMSGDHESYRSQLVEGGKGDSGKSDRFELKKGDTSLQQQESQSSNA